MFIKRKYAEEYLTAGCDCVDFNRAVPSMSHCYESSKCHWEEQGFCGDESTGRCYGIKSTTRDAKQSELDKETENEIKLAIN